ncbi:hypothetical protein [Puniceicoccus vermicola]|uniref:Porin n=1 Tax=Puniceicoccus vermicola TaxID=388746 RepID=A0A7X1E3Q8_9BACT|nr:hypothetical protein [Puniceicoccus vermicola]MBC2601790.1 hypothetical protein [Puniceicoccus vermicola]
MNYQTLLIGMLLPLLLAAETTSTNETKTSTTTDPSTQDTSTTDSNSWVDDTHDWLYNTAHEKIVWFDNKFVPAGQEPLKVPPSRFRLGLYGEVDFGAADNFKLQPVIDLGTDIKLPNLERRLRVFATTKDPSALPGESPVDSNNTLRIGAARSFFKNWDTSAGVKADWPPEAFVNAQWAPTYQPGEHWTLYPNGKVFWDSDEGVGFLGAMTADYWINRWLFRQTLSAKWNKQQQDDDSDDANDPDSYLYGEDGGGYRWAATSLIGYVPKLLNEKEYGRRVNGSDVADGWGIRGRIEGDAAETLSYEMSLMRKGPLYKDYVYYVIAPKVQWEAENNWGAEYKIEIGIEMLIWGDLEHRSR